MDKIEKTEGVSSIDDIELNGFLEAVFQLYGHDYRDYARSSLKRCLSRRMIMSALSNLKELSNRVLNDSDFFLLLQRDLSIKTSELFRDPWVFKELRKNVLPYLRTFPFIRIWVAGCSGGEEVYSLAILLHEERIKNFRFYATDFNEAIIKQARSGVLKHINTTDMERSYTDTGGLDSLKNYCTVKGDEVHMQKWLSDKVLFAEHNLAIDGTFNHFHLILCRNVMIYFNSKLKNRVFQLFHDSLETRGFLCIGTKETVAYSSMSHLYEEYMHEERIYRKA
ncbi:MAG TPA: protein-glutamate O-methyltransferase CheR [Micavibrio sp.]|nr:protein-glutamate O-methyltransferase CheR [Micavibrio sp.]